MNGTARGFIATVLLVTTALSTAAVAAYAGAVLKNLQDSVRAEHDSAQAVQTAWSCAYLALSRLNNKPSRFAALPLSLSVFDPNDCTLLLVTTDTQSARVSVRALSGTQVVEIRFTATRVASSQAWLVTSWERY
jgi:hypothetical protein